MNLTVDSFDKICRSCLSETSNLKSLFSRIEGSDRNLSDVLKYTTNMNIRTDDILPKLVCNECELIMCKADAFKRRCLESELILINISIEFENDFSGLQIDKKYPVKNENIDAEIQNSLNQTSDTSNNSLEDSNYDVKQGILKEFDDDCANSLEPAKSSTGNEIKIVKEESSDGCHDDDFPVYQDESEKVSEMLPMAYKCEKEETYKCFCKNTFDNKNTYDIHLKRYCCDKYKNIFKKLNKVNIIPIKNEIVCHQCNRQFSTVAGWKAHQRSHEVKKTVQKSFKCSICLRKFKHNRTLLAHLRTHNKESVKYVCDKCKREFKYKAYLENHIISLHSGNSLTCDICMQSFTDKEAYKAHRDSHRIDRCYQCGICNKSFYMSSTLKEHLRTHTGEKPFLCSVCGRGFSQRNNMLQHMRRHQGVKPYKCESCEKRFVSKGELDAHTRKHSGAHPFVCDECGNGFTTSSSLVKHRRTHTGERPYACDLCPMRFAATGTLKNHRRTHTGERPYQCSYCEKAFVQKNDLSSHIRCHTGERPYVCTHCGQRFRKPAGLKAHARLHPHQPQNATTLPPPGHNQMLMSTHCDTIK